MEWGYVDIGLQSDESRPASSQIMMVQKERGCEVFSSPIVLLADRPKEEMDAELADDLGADLVGTAVISRSGTPLRALDMERAAVGHARTVVIMGTREVGRSLWLLLRVTPLTRLLGTWPPIMHLCGRPNPPLSYLDPRAAKLLVLL